MALSRMFASLSNRLSEGPFVTEEPNLPSGGHSGYRPEDYRTQSRRARAQGPYRNQGVQPLGYSGSFSMPQLQPATTAPQQMMGYPGTGSQPMTGYTSTAPQTAASYVMNGYPGTAPAPQQGYASMPQQGYAANGYPSAMPQQNVSSMPLQGYMGTPSQPQQGYAANGYPSAVPQTGYPVQGMPAQPTVPQPPIQERANQRKGVQLPTDYNMNSYSGAVPQQPTGYQQNWPNREQKPYQSKFRQDTPAVPQRPERSRRIFQRQQQPQPMPAVQPQVPVQAQPQMMPQLQADYAAQIPQNPNATQPLRREGNVTYMPNLYVGSDGAAYRHVERLTQPMSASTCYRLIEFMRNGETVIVNTELIQDERENQRCLDLLYGAAYTMNCSFTRISAKSIYLIAPSSVSVISYESIRQMNEQDQAVRWPGNDSALLSGNRPRHNPVFGGVRAAE